MEKRHLGRCRGFNPSSLAAGCAWLEGEYVSIAEARIPILDTGLTSSDDVGARQIVTNRRSDPQMAEPPGISR